jgi:hypothetical protein
VLIQTKRGIMSKWLVILAAFFLAAQSVAADDRAKLLGVWRLVALDLEFQDTGERRPTFGKKPNGYLIFTPEGRMMAYLEAENRTAPKTPEEQAAAYRTMLAYTGKYRSRRLTAHGMSVGWAQTKYGSSSFRAINST